MVAADRPEVGRRSPPAVGNPPAAEARIDNRFVARALLFLCVSRCAGRMVDRTIKYRNCSFRIAPLQDIENLPPPRL